MIDRGQEIGQCTIGFLACAYPGGSVMVQRNAKYVTATGPENAANLGEALLPLLSIQLSLRGTIVGEEQPCSLNRSGGCSAIGHIRHWRATAERQQQIS